MTKQRESSQSSIAEQSEFIPSLFCRRYLKRLFTYLLPLVTHGSFKKYLNLLRVEIEYLLKKRVLTGRPYFLRIDPTNLCNLKCVDCYTGRGLNKRPRGMISFDTFKRIIDQHKDFAFKANLYNWGEPFLVPELLRMVRYAADNNISVAISSNMSLPETSFRPDEIIDSGLEVLIMSIDGIDQKTNELVRQNSNFDRIVDNARRMLEAKKRRGSFYPIIEWQFLVHEANQHQLEEARRLARLWGVNYFRVSPHYAMGERYIQRDAASDSVDFDPQHFVPSHCCWPYRSVLFNWNGDVSPCCNIVASDTPSLSYGNIMKDDFAHIWNNEMYAETRLFVATATKSNQILLPCLNCQPCMKQSKSE